MKALGALLLATLAFQDPAPSGIALERTVRATYIDWLGQKREVRRRESVVIRGANVAVTDLTFGEKLIIRADRKTVTLADPLGGHYSEYTFEEAAAVRKRSLDELRSVKAHVPGTADAKEIDTLLEGYDQFPAPPSVELKATGAKREVIVNGALVRVSVEVDPKGRGTGTLEALAAIGAFHPSVAEKFKDLGGLPVKGKLRYVLFMDRVVEEFEVTSVTAREIADAEFDLPAGLHKVPLKGFGRPPERKPPKPAEFKRDFSDDGPPPPEKKSP